MRILAGRVLRFLLLTLILMIALGALVAISASAAASPPWVTVVVSGGTVSGTGTLATPTSVVTITASPSSLGEFVGWFYNNDIVSRSASEQVFYDSVVDNTVSIRVGTTTLPPLTVIGSLASIQLEARFTEVPTVTGVTVTPAIVSVERGGYRDFSATVSVSGGAATTVTWSIDGSSHSPGTTISAAGTLTVAANETSSTLTVRATSTVDRSRSGTATVNLTSGSSSSTTQPNLNWSLQPEVITFPQAVIGYAVQESRDIVISNAGTSDLTSVRATVFPPSGVFEITAVAPVTVPISREGQVTVPSVVQVRPVTGLAPGTYTGTLTVATSNGSSKDVALSFTVVSDTANQNQNWSLSPPSITFPSVGPGYSMQPTQVIMINNQGPGVLTAVSASVSSNFDITATPSNVIYGGGSSSVGVRPRTGLAAGTYSGTLTVTTSDGGSRTASLSFTVTGQNRELTVIENVGQMVNNQLMKTDFNDEVFAILGGEVSEFSAFYFNGVLLTRDVDYRVDAGFASAGSANAGSTRITVYGRTFERFGEGTHTISARFNIGGNPMSVSQSFIMRRLQQGAAPPQTVAPPTPIYTAPSSAQSSVQSPVAAIPGNFIGDPGSWAEGQETGWVSLPGAGNEFDVQTGVPNLAGRFALLYAGLAVSAALWLCVVLRKRTKRGNAGSE